MCGFGFWEVFLDSGLCFGFWDVFWILEVFLDCGMCFGFWKCFWILGCVLDSGGVFGFWDFLWILGCVLDSYGVFGFWHLFTVPLRSSLCIFAARISPFFRRMLGIQAVKPCSRARLEKRAKFSQQKYKESFARVR